jgi:3-hydroxyacyl-CoA dehydrogenase
VNAGSMVHFEASNDIGVLTLENPPVNSLSSDVRRDMTAALKEALASNVKAVVLIGGGKVFSAGADINEFDRGLDPSAPDPNVIHQWIEDSSIPIVAAVRGVALGGGLELALACHARVAEPGVKLGLPEVLLGVIPGGGGTQRLPRLVAAETAARMIATGKPVSGSDAKESGLVDHLVAGDLLDGAIKFARDLVGKSQLRRTSTLPAPEINDDAILKAGGAIGRRSPHIEASTGALESLSNAGRMTFSDALKQERKIFATLMNSSTSRALRHLFFAERAAGSIRGVDKTTARRSVNHVGVIGAGTMGSGIAMAFANANIPVTIVEKDKGGLKRGLARIRGVYEKAAAKRGEPLEAAAENTDRIKGVTDIGALNAADLIVEAVFENMDVKLDVFAELDKVAKPGAILATNTSALDVNQIAQATKRPGDVVGMHFFSPANIMKLLEVVRGEETAADVLATATQIGRKIGKVPVVVGVGFGFCANRVLYPYLRQADFLMEEGALPHDIDRALMSFGMAMGPCAMIDMAGQDVAYHVRQDQRKDWPEGMRYSRLADLLVEKKRYGTKSGAGWYTYPAGARKGERDPEIEAMIAEESKRLGIVRRDISDEEIVSRCMYALVNEGAHVVEEGIVERPSDVDLCYVYGMGFPAAKGGPMFWADTIGLDQVYRDIAELRSKHDMNWAPAPLLNKLAESGRSFADLNRTGWG